MPEKMFVPRSYARRVVVEEIRTFPAHDLEITETGHGRAYNYVHSPQPETVEHIPTELEEK